jgi:hypothetical protein
VTYRAATVRERLPQPFFSILLDRLVGSEGWRTLTIPWWRMRSTARPAVRVGSTLFEFAVNCRAEAHQALLRFRL